MKCYRILRQMLGISQGAVAREAGISRVALNTYEMGHRFPTRWTCKKLDEALENLLERRATAAIEAGRTEGQRL